MKLFRADSSVKLSQFSGRAGSFVEPKLLSVGVLPCSVEQALNMGTELVAETSENLHILTWLSAQENIIKFSNG